MFNQVNIQGSTFDKLFKIMIKNDKIFEIISKCLLNYYKTGDIIPCQKLLNIFKSDLKLLEEISK